MARILAVLGEKFIAAQTQDCVCRLERETSAIWKKILAQFWAEGKKRAETATALDLPFGEIERLIWSVGTEGRA